MDKYRHSDPLILQSAELTERTAFCPEDRAVAEYFDGVAPERERLVLERHLADCRYCRARVGILSRLQDENLDARVPGDTLAAAKMLGKTPATRRSWKAPAWAAAALVLLSVFFLSVQQQTGPVDTRQLRNIERPENRFEVKWPVPGQAVAPGAPIRWTGFPEGSHYTVYVLSDAGDLLWTEHLQRNAWAVRSEMGLYAGKDLFFRVEAELPDGRTVSSKHLAFRVTAP